MSDIAVLNLPAASGVDYSSGEIDYFVLTDPVHFETDNRPLKNLAYRDNLMASKIDEAIGWLNASRGTMTDLATRLAVSIEANGDLKTGALPDVSAVLAELTAARNGYVDLDAKIDAMDVNQTAVNLELDRTQIAGSFEDRADAVRKVTPSGFIDFGLNNEADVTKVSSAEGIASVDAASQIRLGHLTHGLPSVVVNGYKLKLRNTGSPGLFSVSSNDLMPDAPATGTRQDLMFLEVWKEEVDKSNGLFFAYGNTQNSSSTAINGETETWTPTYSSGSAYFTPSDNVYAVEAANAPDAFIQNPEHNIGILKNGNYFQVRYRVRVEAGVAVEATDGSNMLSHLFAGAPYTWDGTNGNNLCIRPQGQLATPPARGNQNGAGSDDGNFLKQHLGSPGPYGQGSAGSFLGAKWNGGVNDMLPISGLSLDGFTYAIPICAVHRRNTGVYSLANQNGTAINDVATFTAGGVVGMQVSNTQHAVNAGTVVWDTKGNKYKVLAGGYGLGLVLQVMTVSGSGEPIITDQLFADVGLTTVMVTITAYTGVTSSASYINNGVPYSGGRPDALYADIIDRRDVLDLRHKVSLDGDFDIDAMYQESFDSILHGDYRQEWSTQADYDNDGNETGLLPTGIYGNILLESLGLGATVPDAGINTNITKLLKDNNSLKTGFNGMRTNFSDAESTEDFTVMIEDQADGTAAKTHCSEDELSSYNASTHSIETDLTLMSAVDGVTVAWAKPRFLPSHTPEIKWGNGANAAGVLVRTNDFNWSFEVKQYGAISIVLNSGATTLVGLVVSDAGTGKNWKCVREDNDTDLRVIPDYASGNAGDVLPSGALSWVSGGVGSFATVSVSSATYDNIATALILMVDSSNDYGIGYDNTAHGTGANESIFATYKVQYRAGSSCLPELPYDDYRSMVGAKVFIDGIEAALPNRVYPAAGLNSHTKRVDLTGFYGRDPVINNGAPGVGPDSSQAHNPTVLYHDSKYKMWYTGSDGAKARICYAESADGVTWEKVEGAETKGCVMDVTAGKFDSDGCNSPRVILDGSTYKMMYSGQNGSGNLQIGYATSSDGIAWTKQNSGDEVIALGTGGAWDDVHVTPGSIIKDGSTFKLWYAGHDGAHYRIGYATSSDCITWAENSTYVMNISGTTSGEPDSNTVSRPCVIKDGALYKMFYTGVDAVGYNTLLYAVSSDGENWIKKGSLAQTDALRNLDTGDTVTGEYSSYHMAAPSIIKVDKAYKMWFGANHTTWQIGYGIIAMSDTANSGSSTTGVYANTAPQVNLGFKAADSVILHYERLAHQGFGIPGGSEIELTPKNYVVSNSDTTNNVTGNDLTEQYSPDYMYPITYSASFTGDPLNYVSESRYLRELKAFSGMYIGRMEDLSPLLAAPSKWGTTTYSLNNDWKKRANQDGLRIGLSYTPEQSNEFFVAGTEFFTEVISGDNYSLRAMGFHVVKFAGQLMVFETVLRPTTEAASRLYYLIGGLATTFKMIGRPLVK